MRKFLMTLVVLSICINAAWAGGSKPSGTKLGHPGKWRAWSKKQYSQRLGCWLYRSDEDQCWYCYDPVTDTFVPCDN